MNQNNGKNSMGLDSCFEEHENPIDLFKKWFDKAKENEINDPNALALATSGLNNQPNVRMVLLKGISSNGFVFFTNFNSLPVLGKFGSSIIFAANNVKSIELLYIQLINFETLYIPNPPNAD